MTVNLAVAVLLAGVCSDNASPVGIARMTVSKMKMTDLESSASGYAYYRQGGLPVSHVRYTDRGSGRYYQAPAPVHYVVDSSVPVAPTVSETASQHEPVLLAYATMGHEITPYAARQPYPRDGLINYNADQLAKYARLLEPAEPAARAPYYTPSAFRWSEMHGNVNKRSDRVVDDDKSESSDDTEEGSDSEEDEDEHREIEDYEKNINFTGTPAADAFDHSRTSIDASFEFDDGVKYSAEQNSAHEKNHDKGHYQRKKFDMNERERHGESRQQEHYGAEREDEREHSDVAKNYGQYDEAEESKEASSYRQTSYHKKGQKTSGFHKVYHKDEYKKETDFYDESHEKGYFDKHAAADEHRYTAEGDFKKGEYHERGV